VADHAHGHRHLVVDHVVCAVLTVSDTRSPADDVSGARVKALLGAAGHAVASYGIVPDDPQVITDAIAKLLDDPAVDAVILNGGTGLAPRDTTLEAVRGLLDKEIPGFGELFRHLSYADVGPAAMLSRATAGVARGKIVVSMPGSPAAVELAMTKLVLPELGHMVFLARGSR
jgi:molybdenum cofactor biosynthesis protein B